MKRTLATLLSLLIVSIAAAVVAAIPAGKETLSIDQIEGKKGAVKFEHTKHATEYKKADGSAIACADCHHTAKTEADVKACSTCHVKQGAAQVEHEGKKAPFVAEMKGDSVVQKSIVFHDSCIGCHKKIETKKIDACKTCH